MNCRVLPENSLDYVIGTLTKVVDDDQVKIAVREAQENSPASALRPDLMHAMAARFRFDVARRHGASGHVDRRYRWPYAARCRHPDLRRAGFFFERDDYRAHGRDERIAVKSFYEGQTFLYELVKTLSTAH